MRYAPSIQTANLNARGAQTIPSTLSDRTQAGQVPAEGARFVAVRKADVDAAQEAGRDTVPVVATGTVAALTGHPMSGDLPMSGSRREEPQ